MTIDATRKLSDTFPVHLNLKNQNKEKNDSISNVSCNTVDNRPCVQLLDTRVTFAKISLPCVQFFSYSC
ncbi:uncharacterized protein PHALS_15220 [Plasmopara halstedii]|uniref:Uncharacterized protein n=1 Tax=Plasmopara halstedii TaxID=4781 RepID=A0A0P1B535_PLAHL|nr:uncharacterized protein PHALS_15220 [Plasmopara halstedii]CEG49522.1 hypothetical protein PHALS_15220 [Plasmopara halstedii]|eukprot:XP_024585891.1 hypothetical protein PHALS_15220 [Plasmopara halstedii]